MSSFSHISKELPNFSKYLEKATAEKCVKKMAKKKEGKPLVQFVKQALDLKKWQTDPALKSLLDHAVTKRDSLSKKQKHEFDKLAAVFKAQIQAAGANVPKPAQNGQPQLTPIAQLETHLETHPNDPKTRYDLACLYMASGDYIAALALLKVTATQLKKSPSTALSLDTVKEKIKECKKKVDNETQEIGKLASKINGFSKYITKLAKNKVSKDISKIVKKTGELLPIEASLIRLYTENYYQPLNMHLRQDTEGLKKYLKESDLSKKEQKLFVPFMNKTVPIIKHSIKKLPSLQTLHEHDASKRTVFRGIGVSLDYISKLQKELKMKNAGFSSASTDSKIALKFAISKGKGREPLLFITEGQNGVPIHEISALKHEREVLFPPNTEFQITEIEKASKKAILEKKIPGFEQCSLPLHLWIVKMRENMIAS